MAVYESALPKELKATAGPLVLKFCFNDEGTAIRPSIARVAWMVGKSERQVRADFAELINRGILVTPAAVDPRVAEMP